MKGKEGEYNRFLEEQNYRKRSYKYKNGELNKRRLISI